MVQLAITQALTPTTLIIRVTVDPYQPEAPMVVSGIVYAADESVLCAGTVQLEGVEADFLDSLVEVMTHAWQWGAPAQQLVPAMKRMKKQAAKHRKLHERKA